MLLAQCPDPQWKSVRWTVRSPRTTAEPTILQPSHIKQIPHPWQAIGRSDKPICGRAFKGNQRLYQCNIHWRGMHRWYCSSHSKGSPTNATLLLAILENLREFLLRQCQFLFCSFTCSRRCSFFKASILVKLAMMQYHAMRNAHDLCNPSTAALSLSLSRWLVVSEAPS